MTPQNALSLVDVVIDELVRQGGSAIEDAPVVTMDWTEGSRVDVAALVSAILSAPMTHPGTPIFAEHNEPILVPYVWRHITKRWPTSTPFKQVAKVAEEAGEAIGAAIKHDEGRKTEQDVRDELADTIIAAIGALQARGADAAETVFDRWAGVVIR